MVAKDYKEITKAKAMMEGILLHWTAQNPR
uniref:Uncharacterized protein n=1 Tax=Arundo donax TaxID=35708 RepID=A0A0A9G6I1_ARUDO